LEHADFPFAFLCILVFFVANITTINGKSASVLGLAAHAEPSPGCVERALDAGVNYFFFYGPGHKEFISELKRLAQSRRDDTILASGSGARTTSGLKTARRKILGGIGSDALDIFFAEYINPDDDVDSIFGDGGVLDQLQQWKTDGVIRYAGATAHDRRLARRLAEDSRVDVLMHRFNMAHRKAAAEVFPAAQSAQTPVIAFTATRWGTLLKQQADWSGPPPTAVDCYRYCLAQPAVRLVLTAPKSVAELDENLAVMHSPPMSEQDWHHWERYGELIYEQGRGGSHDFESRWP
jgi:aryl-alcohol dehydrogenase-like predicted oxidoreductase